MRHQRHRDDLAWRLGQPPRHREVAHAWAGRKVFDEQDARRCLAAVKQSGRELAMWARAHGVDGRALNLWRVNLERRGGVREGRAPTLVEVVVAQTPVVPASASPVLRVGGVELEVGSSFDEGALRRLVQALTTC